MYPAVLTIHSWLRWAALLLGAIATFNAFRHRADTAERPRGQRWDWAFMLAVDLQVLCGLLLYFGLSPFTSAAMSNMGAALRDPGLRFWVFTHAGDHGGRARRGARGPRARDGRADIPGTAERTLHLFRDRGAGDGGGGTVARAGECAATLQVVICWPIIPAN